MRYKNGLLCLLLILILAGCSQSPEQTDQSESSQTQSSKQEETMLSQTDKDSMIGIFEDMQEAMIERDIAALDRILPEDFIAVHITGRTQTKAEWLQILKMVK